VLKALEKDPERRYASVHALAEDTRRFLNNEPIAARPPSALYQLRKFAQRNRALVGGLVAAFASVLIGLSVATYGLVTASTERDPKAKALSAEILARGEAEAISDFLSNMLASADPNRRGRDAPVIDLLDAAAGSAHENFAGRPLVQARLRHVIGATYQRLGAYDQAEPHLRFALDTRTVRLGEQHPDTIDSMHELGALYNEWGRFADAEPLDRRALELNRLVRGNEHERTLNSLHELGLLYSRQGRYHDALPLQEEAHQLCRRLLGELHPTTLSAAGNLGLLYKRLGRYDDALAMYQGTLAARREVLGPEHPDTLVSMNNLAHLYRTLGRLQDSADLHAETLAPAAAEHFRAALAINEAKLPAGHWRTGQSRVGLARAFAMAGSYAEAEPLLLSALDCFNDAARASDRAEAIERLVSLYEAWDVADPGNGFDQKAAEWRELHAVAP